MEKDIFLGKEDIQKIFNCSQSKAYKIIKGLNDKLIKDGAPKESIQSGKVSKSFLCETLKISI